MYVNSWAFLGTEYTAMWFYLPSISPLSLFLEEPPRLLFEFLEDMLGLEPALPEGLATQQEKVNIYYNSVASLMRKTILLLMSSHGNSDYKLFEI